MTSFVLNDEIPSFRPFVTNPETPYFAPETAFTPFVLNPEAPCFVPEARHPRLSELMHRNDIPYPCEFSIDPTRVWASPPPHIQKLRPSIDVQLSLLPQGFTYAPLDELPNEKKQAIQNVWNIAQQEIDEMECRYRQRGPCPLLPQTTQEMLCRIWEVPDEPVQGGRLSDDFINDAAAVEDETLVDITAKVSGTEHGNQQPNNHGNSTPFRGRYRSREGRVEGWRSYRGRGFRNRF